MAAVFVSGFVLSDALARMAALESDAQGLIIGERVRILQKEKIEESVVVRETERIGKVLIVKEC